MKEERSSRIRKEENVRVRKEQILEGKRRGKEGRRRGYEEENSKYILHHDTLALYLAELCRETPAHT